MDFTIYNANVNLFCVCKLVFEFPPTGGIIRSERWLFTSDCWSEFGSSLILVFRVIYYGHSDVFKCFSFNTVKLLRYVSVTDHMVLGFEIVFFLFVIYYLVEEILEIKKVWFRGAVNIQKIILLDDITKGGGGDWIYLYKTKESWRQLFCPRFNWTTSTRLGTLWTCWWSVSILRSFF